MTNKWFRKSGLINDSSNQELVSFLVQAGCVLCWVFPENSERKIWGNEIIYFWENLGLSLCPSSWELRKQSIVVIFFWTIISILFSEYWSTIKRCFFIFTVLCFEKVMNSKIRLGFKPIPGKIVLFYFINNSSDSRRSLSAASLWRRFATNRTLTTSEWPFQGFKEPNKLFLFHYKL